MVFVGNINQCVETLVKTSHLLAPFPDAMIDSAFFDRFHAYIPGWEIPKMRPEFFTNQYGLIVDYLAEWLREMRKRNFADAIDRHFKLGNNLNQRDTIAVRTTVSGLLKLLYPDGRLRQGGRSATCLEYALEARRRVKEQLKKIGGMEFYDVHFTYIDLETLEEHFVSRARAGRRRADPRRPAEPRGACTPSPRATAACSGCTAWRSQATPGTAPLRPSGLGLELGARGRGQRRLRLLQGQRQPRQRVDPPGRSATYHLHLVELQRDGAPSKALTLASFIALCSAALGKPVQSQMVVLGDMTLGGTISPVENLAESLQVAFDAGGEADPAADVERDGHPVGAGGAVREIPDELLFGSGGCGVQGAWGGVRAFQV